MEDGHGKDFLFANLVSIVFVDGWWLPNLLQHPIIRRHPGRYYLLLPVEDSLMTLVQDLRFSAFSLTREVLPSLVAMPVSKGSLSFKKLR